MKTPPQRPLPRRRTLLAALAVIALLGAAAAALLWPELSARARTHQLLREVARNPGAFERHATVVATRDGRRATIYSIGPASSNAPAIEFIDQGDRILVRTAPSTVTNLPAAPE